MRQTITELSFKIYTLRKKSIIFVKPAPNKRRDGFTSPGAPNTQVQLRYKIICIEIKEVLQNHTDWHMHQLQEIGFSYDQLSLQPQLSE